MSKSLPGHPGLLAADRGSPLRQILATLVRQASRGLARLAHRLHHRPRARPQRPAELEFYAEAGAPEGALYLDGELVGHLPGVSRL